MKKWFLIKYEVDTGWENNRDTALIEAEDEIEAKEYLKRYIGRLGNDYMVSRIFEIKEFGGYIFTGRYGFGTL